VELATGFSPEWNCIAVALPCGAKLTRQLLFDEECEKLTPGSYKLSAVLSK
jgi:hypothetical protein